MKKIIYFLRMTLVFLTGLFLGSGLCQYRHYRLYPEIYQVQSAPWYLNLCLQGVFFVIVAAVILIILAILTKKQKS